MTQDYKELVAWQKAIDLVMDVYEATGKFPREELYGLTSQLRRASFRFQATSQKDKLGFQKPTFVIFYDKLVALLLK